METIRKPEPPEPVVVDPERTISPWWEDERETAAEPRELVSPNRKPEPVTPPVAAEPTRRSDRWWVDERETAAKPRELVSPNREPEPVTPPAAAEPTRRSDKWWVDEGQTTVGGPSFLGLSSGDNVESGGYSYLFQGEEERSHAGRWVALLLLLVLGGVVYAKWQPIRDYVLTMAVTHSKPQVQTPPANGDQSATAGTTTGSSTTAASSAPATTLASSDAPSQPTITTENKAENKTPKEGLPQADKESAAAAAKPPDNANSNAAGAASGKADSSAASKTPGAQPGKTSDVPAKAGAKPQPAKEEASAERSSDDKAVDDVKSSAAGKARGPQENPGGELVNTGEKYLYGHGVARSCNQAVSYFNAAAAKQNPQAFSHLGALYATGECVPMDRATAYAYFRRAYAKEPANHYFEQNLTMLWREMTPDERQRATGNRTASF
ncbi:MAG: tetratricopeptide repeat protein [Terriglobales bacterium]